MIRLIAFAALIAAAQASVAAAQHPAKPPAQLGLCASCHGERGMAVVPGTPNLAGQRQDYLLDALKQYRDGRRNVPQMRAAAGALSEAQMQALVRWYAGQTPTVSHGP